MPRFRPARALLAVLAAVPLAAQDRPAITAAVRPFVSVDAPVVALTHVDGVGYDSARLREAARRKVGVL